MMILTVYYVKITQIQQVFSMFVCNIKQANIYDAPQTIQRDWHLWCIYDVGVDLSSSSLSGAYVGTST